MIHTNFINPKPVLGHDKFKDIEKPIITLHFQLILESRKIDGLSKWPAWFKQSQRLPGGRFTFTTNRHYTKDSPLQPAGLLGPVQILIQ